MGGGGGGGRGKAYAEAVSLYLGLCIGRLANRSSKFNFWDHKGENVQQIFARQALPMIWDFVEANVFSSSTGNFSGQVSYLARAVETLPASPSGIINQEDARSVEYQTRAILNTDPPYYDNIGYADLSDYFYVWLRPTLKDIYPKVMSVLETPKVTELVASAHRHGSKKSAESFFLEGMREVMGNAANGISSEFPAVIYYAFKANEVASDGIYSPGWATFIQALIDAGFSLHGTWPIRSEYTGNLKKKVNALANSVVLVCRKREETAETTNLADFLRMLKLELPNAIATLQRANIAPADMPQSAIGPGIGIFSRFKAVLQHDDTPMTVKTALQHINAELDEFLSDLHGEFDPETRFAVSWFELHGFKKGEFGEADKLARARDTSVDSAKHSGIIESAVSKVRIRKRKELEAEWNPDNDDRVTIWKCCQHLIRTLEIEGEFAAAMLLKKIGPSREEMVKDLAYHLFDLCEKKLQDAKEANSYNGLISVWAELTRQAATISDIDINRQTKMDI